MSGINLKHTLATVAVAAGLLAGAGSASAATHQSGVVGYNGHAAGVTDGTSNTIAFGAHAAASADSQSTWEAPRTSPQTVSGRITA
jgi:hypothetical protein